MGCHGIGMKHIINKKKRAGNHNRLTTETTIGQPRHYDGFVESEIIIKF